MHVVTRAREIIGMDDDEAILAEEIRESSSPSKFYATNPFS